MSDKSTPTKQTTPDRPTTLGLPASSLTDAQLDTEERWLDAEWKELREMLEESGGCSGSPGEWIYERSNEIDNARKRRGTVNGTR